MNEIKNFFERVMEEKDEIYLWIIEYNKLYKTILNFQPIDSEIIKDWLIKMNSYYFLL